MLNNKAVAIVSGGMDSVTMAHTMHKIYGYKLHLISYNYGQRHKRELEYAQQCAVDLEAQWDLVDLTSVTKLLPGSALTDPTVQVPLGHYEAESMRSTVVPNRNAMMLSIAFAAAVAEGAVCVGIGVHGGDHAIYSDCREEFIVSFQKSMRLANEGFTAIEGVQLLSPFIRWSKADIVQEGMRLGVDYTRTWSCYQGGEIHCGLCGTCSERRGAFDAAGVIDPTIYRATREETKAISGI